MIKRIDHIAIAVGDLDAARRFFLDGLGGRQVWAADVEPMGFTWTTIDIGSSCLLELVHPLGEGSFLRRFLDRHGDGAHHITFHVHDAAEVQRILNERGIPTFGLAEPYPGWKEVYVHPRDAFGILLQFAEFDPFAWIEPGTEIPSAYRAMARDAGAVSRLPVEIECREEGTQPVVELRQGEQAVTVRRTDLGELIERLRVLQQE